MRSRAVPGEEEYDLNDDGDGNEDEEQKMRRMVRGIWDIK